MSFEFMQEHEERRTGDGSDGDRGGEDRGGNSVVIVGTTPRLVGRSGRTGTVSPAASDGKLGRDMSVRPRDTEAHSGAVPVCQT